MKVAAVVVVQLLIVIVFFKGFILPREQCDSEGVAKFTDRDRIPTLIIIIDALRYDMTTEDGEDGIESMKGKTSKLLSESPTATAQRLKAIGTGGIPAFMEVGRAFDSDSITEDNILKQSNINGLTTAVMGDDTWLALYPKHLWTTFRVFPSFNVHDLDTVDNGIMNHLDLVIQNNKLIHDLTILHFLGIDHAGHRYGKNHPEMRRKIVEANDNINNITAKLSNSDNIILIFGDHGMTDGGEHGGGTELEVTSAIEVIRNPNSISMPPSDDIQQIDLTTTLSCLLSIPIPYVNVGCLNEQIYFLSSTPSLESTTTMISYIENLVVNMWQVYNGLLGQGVEIVHYRDEMEFLTKKVEKISKTWKSKNSKITINSLKKEINVIKDLLKRIILRMSNDARSAWAEMNPTLMYIAVVWCALIAIWTSFKDGYTLPVHMIPVVIHSISLLSNSYIIREEAVVLYLLQSTLLFCFLKQNDPMGKMLIALSMVVLVTSKWFVPGRSVRVFGTHVLQQSDSVSIHDVLSMREMIVIICFPCFIYSTVCYYIEKRKMREFVDLLNNIILVLLLSITAVLKIFLIDKFYHDLGYIILLILTFVIGVFDRRFESVKFKYFFIMIVGLRTTPVWLGHFFIVKVVNEFQHDSNLKGVILYLLSWGTFFNSGHQTTLSGIDVGAAFVGFSVLHHTLQGVALVGLNTFSSFCLPYPRPASWFACFFIHQTGILLSVSIHRKHLMIWEIFAPRMLFAVVITSLCVLQMIITRAV